VRKLWIGLLAALVVAGLAASLGAQAPKSQLRTVHGFVVDKEEHPLPGGIVFLKNLKTLSVKTYVADEEGRYRYSGLDPNVDYEIHAEHQDLTSPKRMISSLDGRREIIINLKVDKKKE
jgi:hypothetical protein